ncbi:MAG: DUF4339 domain-containing protein [Caulobacteraceae bacterium]
MNNLNEAGSEEVKRYVWHYRKDNQEHGPYTYGDIAELVEKGEIGPEDYIWRFGSRYWVKAGEVEGLFKVKEQPEEKPQEIFEEKPEEKPEHAAEKAQEDIRKVFDSMTTTRTVKHKKESAGLKIGMIAAGALLACLAIWIIFRLI